MNDAASNVLNTALFCFSGFQININRLFLKCKTATMKMLLMMRKSSNETLLGKFLSCKNFTDCAQCECTHKNGLNKLSTKSKATNSNWVEL